MSPDKQPHVTHRHPDDSDEPVEIPEINREIGRILVPFDGSTVRRARSAGSRTRSSSPGSRGPRS